MSEASNERDPASEETSVEAKTKAELLQLVLSGLRSSAPKDNSTLEQLIIASFRIEEVPSDTMVVKVLHRMNKLVRELLAEIDQTSLKDSEKQILREFVAPYEGFFTLGMLHKPFDSLKDGHLSESRIKNLTFLSIAINDLPKIQPHLFEEIQEIIKGLEEVIEKLKSARIQAEVREFLLREILNLTFILRHYEIFGHAEIDEGVSRLVGRMVMTLDRDAPQAEKEISNSISKPLKSLFRVLGKTSDWGQKGEWLSSKALQIYESLKSLPPPSS